MTSKKKLIGRIFDAAVLQEELWLTVVDPVIGYNGGYREGWGLSVDGKFIFIFSVGLDYWLADKNGYTISSSEAIEIVNRHWRNRLYPVKYIKKNKKNKRKKCANVNA